MQASSIVRSSIRSYVEPPADFVDTIPGISWVDIEARVDVDVVEQFSVSFLFQGLTC